MMPVTLSGCSHRASLFVLLLLLLHGGPRVPGTAERQRAETLTYSNSHNCFLDILPTATRVTSTLPIDTANVASVASP